MIQVRDLNKSYGSENLLDNISFNINAGERCGLVGRNGHGKTTLFRIIAGMEEKDSGSIMVPRNYTIGYLDQKIKFSRPTVLQEVCLGLPPDHKEDIWMAEKLLAGLGFSTADMEKNPDIFSGGYQVRIQLARTLAGNPNLLLLDEPTNYLDIVSIRWLSRFLRDWKKEFILITHDRSFMDNVTTHTMGIHRRKIRKIQGGTDKLYEQLIMEEEVYEKTRVNDEKKRKEVLLFISRFRAKARLGGLVQSRVKLLEKTRKLEKLEKMKTLEFSFREAETAAKWVLETRDLTFSYTAKPPYIIEGFNLTVGREDRIGIIGKNGAGKSTLIKLMTENLMPQRGEVRYYPGVKKGYFAQTNIDSLDPSRTIVEEIQASHPEHDPQAARDISGAMLFEGDNALKKVSVLSGGEKSRVLLGKLLVSPTHLLMLDEPTNHLDMESCDSLVSALDAFNGAVIIVTHNEMFLNALTNRLIIFDRGRVTLFEGNYRDFLKDIGWSSEENPGIKGEINPAGKKAIRQARAIALKEKSKTLKPIEEKIKEAECAIGMLEEQISKDNELVIEASIKGDGGQIAVLSKKISDGRAKLDGLYEAWENLHAGYEEELKKFDGGAL
ncbi:MAG: ABC-F family ATP-binding cassette domain-containing protein [Brevinematales bacterium]